MADFKRVAVLGAGVMGAGIAAHLANAGIPSLLFDIDQKFSSGALQMLPKSKPALLYSTKGLALITACNYNDHAARLGECDLIIEVVVERLDIKKKVFETVAKHRKPGSIVTSNTSGIALSDMVADMPEEMRQHFAVTHFFNPVRYMRLLEIVVGPETLPEVGDKLRHFGAKVLGKGIVNAKDTPNFIANRIGTFGMGAVFRNMAKTGLDVEAVDMIFGQAMGRPKSAVFSTADVVGIDTLSHVFATVYNSCPDDEEREVFQIPEYVTRLIADGRTGRKAGAGFYKMMKAGGKKELMALNLETLEYKPLTKPRFASVTAARSAEGTPAKIRAIIAGNDAAAKSAWAVTAETLIYSANRIPEIADDIVNIDNGMKWGFGWELGPFETWDAIGVRTSVERMKADGFTVPAWVQAMLDAGRESFYARDEAGAPNFWQYTGDIAPMPKTTNHLFLADVKAKGGYVKRNASADLLDLGDGVLGLEFHGKMNALDELVFEAYEGALDRLDTGEFSSLVVGNQDGKAFCAGANLLMILMGAMQQQFDMIDASVLRLQTLMMRAKYNEKPVITVPYGLTLGGGAEVTMHSSATVAGGELYIGLVEVGVGLIPAGGGCKEMVVRALGDIPQDIAYDPNPFVQKVFERLGLAKMATSAEEAREMGFLRPTDKVVLDYDALIGTAKQTALGMVASGYVPPAMRTVKLPGPNGAAAIELFLNQMHDGGYATDHDVTVGKKLAHVLTGGDIPFGTVRTEWDLLDLEREAFLSLCGEFKSQARMQYMLQNGKPLRN